MLGRPLHLSPLGGDLDSLKSGSSGSAHSGSSGKSRSSHRSSPTAQQPLPPNSRNTSLSFSPASFPYSSLQQQQQNSPYLHKPEKMFRGRLDLPPEENADLEELEKFAKMFKQKRIKLGERTVITFCRLFYADRSLFLSWTWGVFCVVKLECGVA
jgi:hypothetical protein